MNIEDKVLARNYSKKSLDALSQKGVRSFRTYAREGVLRLFNKMKINYTTQSSKDAPGGVEVSVKL